MRKYIHEQTRTLARRVAFHVNHTAQAPNANSIHDLRVSIRRFNQCLRTFSEGFPEEEAKRIRQRLRRIMNLAGEVRNHDIALELLKKAGVPVDPKLEQFRQIAKDRLIDELRVWRSRDFAHRWRERLHV